MLPAVTRRRLPVLMLLILAALPLFALAAAVPPAFAQEEAELPADQQPAVVVSESGGTEEDEAWTFRFLVPTVLAISAIALVATVLVYGIRVRGRYRVVR